MKKLLLLMLPALLFIGTVSAQLRTTTRSNINQGTFLDFPGSLYAATPAASQMDTLQVSDTVAYILPISHTNDVTFYQTWYWSKAGSGTATITLSFYQGNDPYNFTAVLKGTAQSAYTKTYTLSASGWQYVSFTADTATFSGRYLKVQYMTSSTASVGGKVFTRVKSNIK